MLPNSTERAITIAGTTQSIIECVKQICVIMLEVNCDPQLVGHFPVFALKQICVIMQE